MQHSAVEHQAQPDQAEPGADEELLRPALTLNDFDMFIGLSAGSVLASALAAGIEADELFKITINKSDRFSPLHAYDFMRPNFREPAERIALLQAVLQLIADAGSVIPSREAASLRRVTETRIRTEQAIDLHYSAMSSRLMNEATRGATRARIADVQRVLDRIPREDARLGRRRPDVVQALQASVQAQLGAVRQRLQLEGAAEHPDDVGMLMQDVGVGTAQDLLAGGELEQAAGFVVDDDEAAFPVDREHTVAHISHQVAEKHVVCAHGSLGHQHCCRAGLSKAHAPLGSPD